MEQPNPEVDELREILRELDEMVLLARTCKGDSDISNRALSAIKKKAENVARIVRALDETNLFSLEEIQFHLDREKTKDRNSVAE
jgi:hypothetical protein